MKDFEALLAESVTVHGHICAGQVIGVRMSMLALQRIGIDDPREPIARNSMCWSKSTAAPRTPSSR